MLLFIKIIMVHVKKICKKKKKKIQTEMYNEIYYNSQRIEKEY